MRSVLNGEKERKDVLNKYLGKTISTRLEFGFVLQAVKKAEVRGEKFSTIHILGFLKAIDFNATGEICGFNEGDPSRKNSILVVYLTDVNYNKLLMDKVAKNKKKKNY